MSFTYRGISYQSTSTPVTPVKAGQLGKFRGVTYPLNHSISVPVTQPSVFKYRGVTYTRGNLPKLTTQTHQPLTFPIPVLN